MIQTRNDPVSLPASGVNALGHTDPVWYRNQRPPNYPALTVDVSADVVVGGAGIAGLTTAYLAAKAGLSVVVLDAHTIAAGESGRTSAHLASAIDDRFFRLERSFDIESVRLLHESHVAAIDLIESIASDEGIDCEFKRLDGYLFAGSDEKQETLRHELEAARRAGVNDVERLSNAPGLVMRGRPCLRFGNQARFHPLKFLVGLARRLEAMGVAIHGDTFVKDMVTADRRVRVTTEHGPKVDARFGVAATNVPSPINNWAGIYTKFAAYRTYMVGLELADHTVADALYWDANDPYHYVRLEAAEDRTLLLVGGEDHKTGQSPDDPIEPFKRLASWARQSFNGVGRMASQWTGQVNEPDDGVAFIGPIPTSGHENCFVITGDSGMGLTHGALGAMIVVGRMLGRPPAWADVYRPSRKPLHNLGTFIRENANAIAQFADYVTPGEVKSADEIPAGGGALVRCGLKKIAVHRDDAGHVHACSAVCTHLGGMVRWNDVEKSWDCPLHGSRFDPRGEVLIGPAVDGLSPAERPAGS